MSPPPRRTRGRDGSSSTPRGAPLRSIRLTVTLKGASVADLERLAADEGLVAGEKGGDASLAFTAATPEDALAHLRLLAGLLAPKG